MNKLKLGEWVNVFPDELFDKYEKVELFELPKREKGERPPHLINNFGSAKRWIARTKN